MTLLHFHYVGWSEPCHSLLHYKFIFLPLPFPPLFILFSHTSSHLPSNTTLNPTTPYRTVPYRTVPYRTVHPYSPYPASGATYSVSLPPSSVLVSENFVSRVVDANELSALTSCRLGKITQVRNWTFNLFTVFFSFVSYRISFSHSIVWIFLNLNASSYTVYFYCHLCFYLYQSIN